MKGAKTRNDGTTSNTSKTCGTTSNNPLSSSLPSSPLLMLATSTTAKTTSSLGMYSRDVQIALLLSLLLFPLHCIITKTNSNSNSSDLVSLSSLSWSGLANLPLFLVCYDACYYGLHRLHHLWNKPSHFSVHHKPLESPFQAFEFDVWETLSIHVVMWIVQFWIVPLRGVLATTVFFVLHVFQSCWIHGAAAVGCQTLDYPILISPADHYVHHSWHCYNFSTLFKFSDQLFGTYRAYPTIEKQTNTTRTKSS